MTPGRPLHRHAIAEGRDDLAAQSALETVLRCLEEGCYTKALCIARAATRAQPERRLQPSVNNLDTM